ncbi:MAG: cell division protein FtsQ/DivIB [Lachnospiraceae bacterium]|nr:cell division protein FtsQ/DivIB [Lachnospiraceae bacterium]
MKRGAQLPVHNRIRNLLIGIGVAALLLLILWSQKIDTVHVEGVDFYSAQEIEDYLFNSDLERNILYARLKNRIGKNKEIPFVAGYTMEFTGKDTVTVIVHEKSIIGYVDYMGSHMYFDKDGTVVESSSRLLWEGIPLITGLDFDSIVLYRPLPVENENAFTQILNLTQLVGKHGISVDKIYFDSRYNATLYIDQVRVMLGDKTNMEDKIAELYGMLPQLRGLQGVLHLEDYDPAAMNPRYSFIKDEVPETMEDGEASGQH